MLVTEITLKLAGEAGQGVESSGAGFARALHRLGYHVFTTSEYMSRIRGGHNAVAIRVSQHPVSAPSDRVHLLLAFDEASLDAHLAEMEPGAALVMDTSLSRLAAAAEKANLLAFVVPLGRMAEELGGSKVMINTAALGVAAGILGIAPDTMAQVIQENFGRKKGGSIAEANLKVMQAGYEYGSTQLRHQFPWQLAPAHPHGDGRARAAHLLLNGNQSLAMGLVAGGCRFISAYPMTPASSIFEWVAAHADRYGVVAKQAEDEIAAMAMAVGAGHAGARAATATSGGGFSLMVEALGLAGMAEVPVVVIDAQRPGPSTGMPTRTGQGDLLFTLHASQGEFPRIVLAPGSVEEAFDAGVRALNLAEKYQCPVIVLTDGFLATSLKSSAREALDPAQVHVERGELLDRTSLDRLGDEYLRYRITPSGVSPRALPGHPKAVFMANSDEHLESGHFEDEDAANRMQQATKRLRKLQTARTEMRPPVRYGPEEAEITLAGWGSSKGPIEEAVDRLRAQGLSVNALHFVDLWPFPEAAAEAVAAARYLVVAEGNLTGQFARLIRAETGRKADEVITRDDGRPLTAGYIISRLERVAAVHAGRQAV